jgi:integrase
VKPINPTVTKYKYANGIPYWLVAFTRPDGGRYRKKHSTERAAWDDRATQIGIFSTEVTREEIEQARAAILKIKNCTSNDDVKGRTILDAADFFCQNYRDPRKTLPLSDYVMEFLDRKQKENLRGPTVSEIERFLNEFASDFPALDVHDFTPDVAETYLTKTRKPNRNRKAVLNQFFNYLAGTALTTNRAKKVLPMNPLRAIPRRRKDDRDLTDTRILDTSEAIALLRRAAHFNAQRMFVWLLFTGMRPAESLKFWAKTGDGKDGWQFINLARGVITVNGSIAKTRKPRQIKIQPNLKAWLEHYKGRNFLTTNWRDKYAFAKDVLPEDKREVGDICRHTFISYLAHIVKGWVDVELQAGNTKQIQLDHYSALVHDDPKTFWEITPAVVGVFDVTEEEYAKKGYQNRKAAILVNREKIRHKRNGEALVPTEGHDPLNALV